MSKSLHVLCLGDIVGRPGRAACRTALPVLRRTLGVDLVIANAENASGGVGIDSESAQEIHAAGADVLTLGDHTYQRKEIKQFLDEQADWCIRPANYPEGAPGRGWTVVRAGEPLKIGVFNLLGRVFFNTPLDCPFRCAEKILAGPLSGCGVRILDLHAEATSEKVAMGRFLDGRVSVVAGTHTHVQTADEQILPGGTGYLTDLGMCGSRDGVIGMDAETALARLVSGVPQSYKIASGAAVLTGLLAEIDPQSGKTLKIERIAAKEDGTLLGTTAAK